MNIREMHYDFKKKFNKVDSQKNKNYLVPEIDWTLNEALEMYIKLVGHPRIPNGLGFDLPDVTMDDLRTIVKSQNITPVNNIVILPSDYKYYARGRAKLTKDRCTVQNAIVAIQQHDDTFEESTFYSSSFEWREVNGVFNSDGLQLFTDGTFTINEVKLTYIRKHAYIHNAQDFGAGTYKHPSGQTLSGAVNCELPEHTHRQIVDIAVMLASAEVQTSDFQVKAGKLNFNQIN
jgi:hypothetical protein